MAFVCAGLFNKMGLLEKHIEKDFRRIQRDSDSTLIYKGRTVPCLFGSTDEEQQLAVNGAGEMEIYDLVATVRKTDFSGMTLPKKGEVIMAEGIEYQIGKVNFRPGSPLFKIHFANLDQ